MDRRQFINTTALGALGAGLVAPGDAFALGKSSKLGIGLLKHGGGYRERPRSVEQLMWEVTKQTSIDVRERPLIVDASSAKLYKSPLLVWIGTGATAPIPEADRQRLSRFLRAGGTLFIDDATVPGDDSFDASARREIEALMPDVPLTPISNDHTIYRSFFLLQEPYGRVRRKAFLQGTPFDDRCPIIYNRNDLFGALGRDSFGQWLMPVVPGGAAQRERAFRLGINLLMYATCLNYKRDQVHVTAILRRRRWRVDRPNGPTR
ncbi:MAG: DUF4159 domain-containing protein [Bradymonadia bacterium]